MKKYSEEAAKVTATTQAERPIISCQHCGAPAVTRIVKSGFRDRPLCKACYSSDIILYNIRWNP